MAEDGGNTDEGLEGDDHVEDFDVGLSDREVPKWVRPAVWSGIPVVLLVLYVFALPVPIIFLEEKDMLPYGPKLEMFYNVTLGPLTWMYENLGWYQDYLDWLDRLFR